MSLNWSSVSSPARRRAACSRNSATRSASICLSMVSYRYIGAPLLSPDEVDAAFGVGRAGGVLQGREVAPAVGLLAVLQFVGGAERPQSLAVGDGREAFLHRRDVDQVGIDHDGDLSLGVRLGGQRSLIVREQLGVSEAGRPAARLAEEHHLAIVQ